MPLSRLPPHLTSGPFTAAEARAAGLARSRLKAADLSHPHHGVYRVGSPADVLERCEALLPLLGSDHWFSHATAARAWGMPLPYRAAADEPLHVIAASGTAPTRRDGVVGWETATTLHDPRIRGALPLVAPAECWAQLAVPGALVPRRALTFEWLVATGDYLVSGPRGQGPREALCTLDELADAVRRRKGMRGVKVLTEALAFIRSPVDSPEETFLRLGLVGCGLPEPMVQVPVRTAEGVLHGDVGYPEAKVLIEFQGDEHRISRRRWLSDLTRIQLFQDAGWLAFLVGADDVHPTCRPLAGRIARALRART